MPELTNKKPEPVPVPQVIGRGSIILLLAAICILASLMIWFFIGTVKRSFTRFGVMTTEVDAIMIHQPDNAVVTEIVAASNQFVNKGDVIMRVYTLDDEDSLTDDDRPSMEQMAEQAHDIVSPVNGFITEIIVEQWERVDLTSTLAMVKESPTDTVSYAMAYISIEYVENIEDGTNVNIRVQDTDNGKASLIRGSVVSITELPVSEYHILRSTGSSKVVDYLYDKQKKQYEVLIKLDVDDVGELEETGTTQRKSPYVCNEMCQITFFSEEMHPYQVILEK